MDTILIIRDSVATCVNKTTEICPPCMKVTDSFWSEIFSKSVLYITILLIAYWILKGFFNWIIQMSLLIIKRKDDVGDRRWKQKADLQDKLLNYYKDRLIKDKKDDKGNVIMFDDDNCKKYVEQLTNLINELK